MDPIDPWVDAEAVRKLARSLLRPVRREEHTPIEVCFGEGFVGYAGPDLARSAPPSASPVLAGRPAEIPDLETLQQLQEQARQSLSVARHRAENGGLLDRPPVAPVPVASIPVASVATVEVPELAAGRPSVAVAEPDPAPSVVAPSPDPAPLASPPATATPAPPETHAIPAPAPPTTSQAPFVERLHAYGQWLKAAVSAKAFFVTDHDGHVLMDQMRAPRLLQVAQTLAQASHAANRHAGGGTVGSLHVKLGEASILEVLPVETEYGPLILGIVVPSVLSTSAIPVISNGLQRVVVGHSR